MLALLACTDPDPAAPTPVAEAPACQRVAVVTDIDETLTTADGEWIDQLLDPSHDPAERPDAATLMQGYADKGYAIVYLTARGEDLAPEGTTSRDLTVDWLDAHGFPVDPDHVVLAPGPGALGSAAAPYTTDALAGYVADGWSFPYGYGNADTDMEAFETVVNLERLFLVGELTEDPAFEAYLPIPDSEAYTAHLPFLDDVPGCTEWE